jgi:hypothetical protein
MKKLDTVNSMFDYIETNINAEKIKKGGTNDTQPYGSFRSGLNTIYDYFSVIFTNKKTTDEKYKLSVDNLDKSCDCSKYKCKKEDNIEDEHENEDEDENENENEHKDESNIIESKSLNSDENPINETQKSLLLLKTSKVI